MPAIRELCDFGSTERPKFDVRWQPIDQSLTRARLISSFHASVIGRIVRRDRPKPSRSSSIPLQWNRRSNSIFQYPNLQPEIGL